MYFVYMLITNYYFDLNFSWSNVFELMVGTILSTILVSVIDCILYRISFSVTDTYKELTFATGEGMSKFHWRFRFIMFIPILLFSLTPLCDSLMTTLVHDSYILLSDLYHSVLNDIVKLFRASVAN